MSDQTDRPVGSRILIVEDEVIVAEDLALTLQGLGYHMVGKVSTGEEAIQRTEELKPDLVLMDIRLAGKIDGIQAAEEIRVRSDIPIIFITAHREADLISRAKVTQPYGFLAKPISRNVLKTKIEMVLYKHAADKRVRQSEERYRSLVEQSIDGIALVQGATIRFANRALVRMFGCQSPEEMIGQNFLTFVALEDRAVMEEKGLDREAGKSVTDYHEFKALRKDGTSFDAELRASLTTYRGDKVRQGIIRDVTEHRKAKEALTRSRDELERLVAERTAELESSNKQLMEEIRERIRVQESLVESEGRLRGIFETSTDCVFIKDLSFRYILVNSAMCSLFNSTEAEIVGKTDAKIFGKDAAERLRSADDRIAKGEVLEEVQVLPVKGALLTFLTVKTPLTDSNGKVVGICGIARNVTERSVFAEEDIPNIFRVRSAAMSPVLNVAHLAAATDSTILITGESGTGKDYLARYIHGVSRRSSGPYYSINCASIPRDIAESELFGHEAGAFTGAAKKKRGLLELAEGGTLLLNEIAELPLDLQAKLLTFLDTRTFTRVGGEKKVVVDLRLIVATNKNLSQEISAGRFRNDLFYRLNVISIGLPPLRERLEDLPLLVEELIEELGRALGFTGRILIEPRVVNTMKQYTWPGNIRELRNVLERALIISRGGPVKLQHIGMAAPKQLEKDVSMSFEANRPLPDIIAEIERSLIEQALQRAGGNQKQAANLLGISRFALARHMKKCDISSFGIE
jgi:PAS domain S-box-containing protein